MEAAVSNAAREVVRFARSMKTVLERATAEMLDYAFGRVTGSLRRTEPAQERRPFQRAFGGDGAVWGEHAAQHEDVEFSACWVSASESQSDPAAAAVYSRLMVPHKNSRSLLERILSIATAGCLHTTADPKAHARSQPH